MWKYVVISNIIPKYSVGDVVSITYNQTCHDKPMIGTVTDVAVHSRTDILQYTVEFLNGTDRFGCTCAKYHYSWIHKFNGYNFLWGHKELSLVESGEYKYPWRVFRVDHQTFGSGILFEAKTAQAAIKELERRFPGHDGENI